MRARYFKRAAHSTCNTLGQSLDIEMYNTWGLLVSYYNTKEFITCVCMCVCVCLLEKCHLKTVH